MPQTVLLTTVAIGTTFLGDSPPSLDRVRSSYSILASLFILLVVVGVCYQTGLIDLLFRVFGKFVKWSIWRGFLVWEALFSQARWWVFLMITVGLISIGVMTADDVPVIALLCGLSTLFMGVTACLAYMHIDLERYAVERGYKSIHNPVKGQDLAAHLVLYGDRVGVPLLGASAVAVIGGFALLNQGLYETFGSSWYALGPEAKSPKYVDFLAYSLISLYRVVDLLDMANTSEWLRLTYVRQSKWPAGVLLTAFKTFFTLVLLQQIFASIRQGQALAETIADFWSPHPPIHDRARIALPRHGIGVVRPLLDSLSTVDTLTKEQRDQLPLVIGSIGPAAAPALVNYLHNPNEGVRMVAASSIGRLHVVDAIPELVRLSTDSSEMVRQSVVQALGLIGGEGGRRNRKQAAFTDRGRRVSRWSRWLARKKGGSPGAVRPDPIDLAITALRSALTDASSTVRVEAARSLGLIGSPSAVAAHDLVVALNDSDETVRSHAAEALGAIGSAAHVPPLVALLSDPSSTIKVAGARALGSLGSNAASAVAVLATLLQDRDETVRNAVAEAIASIGTLNEEATATLVGGLADADTVVRAQAAEALGAIGTIAADAAPALVDALSDRSDRVRGKAAEALGQIGESAADVAVPSLTRALRDKDNWVSALAAEALGEMGEAAEKAVPALMKSLRHINPQVRGNAAEALGKMGSAASDAIAALEAACRDTDAGVRARAVRALAEVQPDNDIGIKRVSIEALHDPDPQVRAAVVEVLAILGQPAGAIANMVLDLLDDANDKVKYQVVRAIPKLIGPTPEAIEGLTRRLLEDDSAWVREGAAEALGQLGPAAASAGPALLRVAQTGEVSVREEAMRAIARVQPPETSTAFQVGLLDAAEDIRVIASAGWMKAAEIPEDVIPSLIDSLRDPAVQVRANAAHALSRLASLPAEAVPRLIECARDANDGLRMNAAMALSDETSADVAALFRELVDDSNTRIRLIAAGVLLSRDGTDERAAELIAEELADAAPRLRQLALTAIANLGERGVMFRDVLRTRLDQERDPDVHARVAALLAQLDEIPESDSVSTTDSREMAS